MTDKEKTEKQVRLGKLCLAPFCIAELLQQAHHPTSPNIEPPDEVLLPPMSLAPWALALLHWPLTVRLGDAVKGKHSFPERPALLPLIIILDSQDASAAI